MKRCLALAVMLSLAGCAGALQWTPQQDGAALEPAPAAYVVKQGDTLYSIAWRYGLDYHDVASWNRLGRDYLIHPGDKLALAAPAASLHAAASPSPAATTRRADTSAVPSAGALQWSWPVTGQVVRLYHAGSSLSKGIDITASQGTDILAAANGKVVYAGSGIIGYGKLIIIKNSESFLSAYADNDEILVKEGDSVRIDERIATMGLGRDGRPLLHFEIRYDGRPVDPLSYLPRR
ncbi:MAG TPA: peptidoglycan DD-metalloendopeptidase family protein [Gammaproteobacteria bacterium]|nr:peptidoglycan DD-metalloendopeptidase family protein [Gammaproteobacteria bacterium]